MLSLIHIVYGNERSLLKQVQGNCHCTGGAAAQGGVSSKTARLVSSASVAGDWDTHAAPLAAPPQCKETALQPFGRAARMFSAALLHE